MNIYEAAEVAKRGATVEWKDGSMACWSADGRFIWNDQMGGVVYVNESYMNGWKFSPHSRSISLHDLDLFTAARVTLEHTGTMKRRGHCGEAIWSSAGVLFWNDNGQHVPIEKSSLTGCEWAVTLPVQMQLFPFKEAFKKMESGIWMKSYMTSFRYRRNPGGSWAALSSTGMSHTPSFSPHEVAGEWFEYKD